MNMTTAGPTLVIPVLASVSAASVGRGTSGRLASRVAAGFNISDRLGPFALRIIVSGHVFKSLAGVREIITVNFGHPDRGFIDFTQDLAAEHGFFGAVGGDLAVLQ